MQGDTVHVVASGFRPGANLQMTVNRPDGVAEHYSLTAGSDGTATYTFSNAGGNVVLGTYSVSVRNLSTGAENSSSITVVPSSGGSTTPGGTSTP
jgi:hypothetical protein